jgi:hypothetical protein
VNLLIAVVCLLNLGQALSQIDPIPEAAERALHKGVRYFREKVAVEGTYLWQYSEDLSKREGETKATATQGWIQPPGTPSVGMAFLKAWEATGHMYYRDAARETAYGLIRGQLRSGGWHYAVDLDPKQRRKSAYRTGGGESGRNVTTFDDDTTQAAVRFLMRADQALKFSDQTIHEPVLFALESILKAQYPNGAWPQGYDLFPEADKFPVKNASYPEEWPRTWPGSKQYWLRYTLNDDALATTIDTLFEAYRTYEKTAIEVANRCRAAAEKAGGFLLISQMPEPQPAWAQQYDFEMHPSWARKFEPPSVTGGESQGVLRMLLKLYRETGNRKYLQPIPRAIEYLRKSRLEDGRLARFYELRSNKPLFFNKEYQLTHADSDLPTHYSFKVNDQTAEIEREYNLSKNLSAAELVGTLKRKQRPGDSTEKVKSIIASQDEQGRWLEPGKLRTSAETGRVLRSATFIQNVEILSEFLLSAKSPAQANP